MLRSFAPPALALALAACADVGDPADFPVPPPGAAGAPPMETPATQSPPAPACTATGGIWTVELTPVDAQTAVDCGGASRNSRDLSGSPFEAAMGVADCDLGRTVASDGCSVLCNKNSATAGMQVEMLIHYETPTSLSGYAVITGEGVRCEYDVSYTKT